MTVGVYTIELYLPMARSLKDKRQVVQKLKHRARARHNVAVSETSDYADLRQRAGLAFVSIASRREPLERLFESIYNEAASQVPGEVIETGTDFIEVSVDDLRGWKDEAP